MADDRNGDKEATNGAKKADRKSRHQRSREGTLVLKKLASSSSQTTRTKFERDHKPQASETKRHRSAWQAKDGGDNPQNHEPVNEKTCMHEDVPTPYASKKRNRIIYLEEAAAAAPDERVCIRREIPTLGLQLCRKEVQGGGATKTEGHGSR